LATIESIVGIKLAKRNWREKIDVFESICVYLVVAKEFVVAFYQQFLPQNKHNNGPRPADCCAGVGEGALGGRESAGDARATRRKSAKESGPSATRP